MVKINRYLNSNMFQYELGRVWEYHNKSRIIEILSKCGIDREGKLEGSNLTFDLDNIEININNIINVVSHDGYTLRIKEDLDDVNAIKCVKKQLIKYSKIKHNKFKSYLEDFSPLSIQDFLCVNQLVKYNANSMEIRQEYKLKDLKNTNYYNSFTIHNVVDFQLESAVIFIKLNNIVVNVIEYVEDNFMLELEIERLINSKTILNLISRFTSQLNKQNEIMFALDNKTTDKKDLNFYNLNKTTPEITSIYLRLVSDLKSRIVIKDISLKDNSFIVGNSYGLQFHLNNENSLEDMDIVIDKLISHAKHIEHIVKVEVTNNISIY